MSKTDPAAGVRAELARAGKTQGDLASHLGISQPQVSARMRGSVEFRLSELRGIAAWLDVPLAALLPESATTTERSA